MKLQEKSQDKKLEKTAFSDWSQDEGWVTFTAKTTRRLVDAFFRQPHLKSWSKILELGCGTGENTPYLLENASGRIFAFDISKACVLATKSKNPGIHAVVADAEHLPVRDGSFDAIFLGSLLHHFPDTAMLIQECGRILCKDGLFFAFDPNKYNPIIYFYRVVLGSRSMKTDNEVLYSSGDLATRLRYGGFVDPKVNAMISTYFTRDYYTKCIGRFLGHVAYPCNLVEWLICLIPGVRRRLGSFLVSRATKG